MRKVTINGTMAMRASLPIASRHRRVPPIRTPKLAPVAMTRDAAVRAFLEQCTCARSPVLWSGGVGANLSRGTGDSLSNAIRTRLTAQDAEIRNRKSNRSSVGEPQASRHVCLAMPQLINPLAPVPLLPISTLSAARTAMAQVTLRRRRTAPSPLTRFTGTIHILALKAKLADGPCEVGNEGAVVVFDGTSDL